MPLPLASFVGVRLFIYLFCSASVVLSTLHFVTKIKRYIRKISEERVESLFPRMLHVYTYICTHDKCILLSHGFNRISILSVETETTMEGEEKGPQRASLHLPPVYKIVLTGGPCGGKTTAMARLSDFFRGNGFRVYTVPEAATMLFENGVTIGDLGTVSEPFNLSSM